MKSLNQVKVKPTSVIILTPFLDVMTTLLIFLIVTFAPEEARIELSANTRLPTADHYLKGVPSVRIEVSENSIKLNGKILNGATPLDHTQNTWKLLKTSIESVREKNDSRVLVVADKSTAFNLVDITVAHLSASGFSDIYLLTEKKEVETPLILGVSNGRENTGGVQ